MGNFGYCHDMESLTESDDVLWESVKVDLIRNRATYDAKLQTLKGKLVKVQVNEMKSAKQRGVRKCSMKKPTKKTILLKALETIKVLTHKLMRKKRGVLKKNDFNSSINFQVTEQYEETTNASNGSFTHFESPDSNIPQSEEKTTLHCSTPVKDQSVQTGTQFSVHEEVAVPVLLENSCTQMNCRLACQNSTLNGFHLPIVLNPAVCSMCILPCGSSNRGNLPLYSLSHNDSERQSSKRALADQGIQTDENVLSGDIQSPKNVERLIQVAETDKVAGSKELPGNHVTQDLSEGLLRMSNKTAEDVILELQRLSATLLNLQSNMRSRNVDKISSLNAPMVAAASTHELPQWLTSDKYSPTVNLRDVLVENVSNLGDLMVTKEAGLGATSEVKDDITIPGTSETNVRIGHNAVVSRILRKASENESTVVTSTNAIESAQCSAVAGKSDIPATKARTDGTINTDASLVHSAVTSAEIPVEKVLETSNNTHMKKKEGPTQSSLQVVPNVKSDLDTSMDCHRESSSLKQGRQGEEIFSEKSDLNREQDSNPNTMLDRGTNSENSTKPTACKSRSIKTSLQTKSKNKKKSLVSKSVNPSMDGSPVPERNVGVIKKQRKNNPSGEQLPKVPEGVLQTAAHSVGETIQETDLPIASADESKKSPAFEEMDPSELESLLLIWRQQEEIAMEQKNTKLSKEDSSDFVFKKSKKIRELPSELQNIRILKPPPLLCDSSKSSALQILRMEENKLPVGEDIEDVPEISESICISQPKKGRLTLRRSSVTPLPVVFQRSKENSSRERRSSSDLVAKDSDHQSKEDYEDAAEHHTPTSPPAAEAFQKPTRRERKTSEESVNIVRSSERLKAVASNLKEKNVNISEERESKQRKRKAKSDSDAASDLKLIKKDEASSRCDKADMTCKESGKKVEFQDQIKERAKKLKQKWMLERSVDKNDGDVSISDLTTSTMCTPPPSPPISEVSEASNSCIGILLPQDQIKMLRNIPVYEIAKAHDLAVNVLLNPWRGINAKCAIRRFNCPEYDTKAIGRALWDLRSCGPPEDIVDRIISIGWKDFHPLAFRALASMFIICLSRHVSFVIEAASVEEDDTCSVSSDADMKSRKKTPLRIVASKPIFKGECIDGLRGLITNVTNKNKFKSWIFPKFKESHDLAVLGPLAYLKRKESDYNTEAVLLTENVIAAKAIRHIQCGERLIMSFKKIEHSLLQ